MTIPRVRHTSTAPTMLVSGILALVLGLATTIAGGWLAYWRSVVATNIVTTLDGLGMAEPDRLGLYLVVAGGVVATLGALAMYRSQDL